MKQQQIEILVSEFCASDRNTLELPSGEPAWGSPLFGYARGDDPLFEKIKDDIGSFYWTPLEAFRLAYPNEPVSASELSVISYLLPQTEATRKEQRINTELPGERWARSRYYGEAFNRDLRCYLADELSRQGYLAVAPERLPAFAYQSSSAFGIASNWSERHTAWVAGLGTFGLSDGLITRAGKAVRFGSVVARIALAPTTREYEGHQDWCLWYARGTCGACMKRCPVAAISERGHDKDACCTFIRTVTAPYVDKTFGTGDTPCGLCQVKIPCEARSPLHPPV
ncbi:MAG: 4Fe-4S ferredoxin [Desulfuromonas sp.]|nr:MAG: 4Fe-4S ferredoxin [Desulfuromonas sp.]